MMSPNMTETTNSAQVLYKILQDLKDHSPNPQTMPTAEALPLFFEQAKANSNFAYAYGNLHKIFEDVENDIQQCELIGDRSKTIYSKSLSHLKMLIEPTRFASSWYEHKSKALQNDKLEKLETLSDFLEQHRRIRVISQEEIDNIRREAEGLRNQIEEAEDINPELRNKLLKHLNEIIEAISLYKFFGDQDFTKKINEITGELISDPIYPKKEAPKLLTQFGEFMGKAHTIIHKAHHVSDKIYSIAHNVTEVGEFLGIK